ncbi:hypothetical protein ANME2D_00814 [Candidatus Methanoperedens nitroreducens]|uniref:Uncharacterized protein n=1 Tax=Candidatus Methanoperedens nitratireducens TaxID=1392998 RepID=A0A062V4Z1_9EURY|nr:hypothetical protein [Candidatus Methanoperedens nitroreducens]KCZ72387.1 hypothetical protein ANME2D_00814 [Candidatus Methanoperedens nitroreducens]
MLYRIPENKGKRRTGSIRIFTKNPNIKASIKERATENLKICPNFLIVPTLSGLLTVSSFKSVNLFNPYVLNITKKVSIAVSIINVFDNKPEKITLKEPLIAKKSDVDIRNNRSLSNNKYNFDNTNDSSWSLI